MKHSTPPNPEILRELYVEKEMTSTDIGLMYVVHSDTARRWIIQAGIPIRTASERALLKFKQGKLTNAQRSGEKSRNWKGGRRITSAGYIDIWKPGHPRARQTNYVLEHIYLWEEANGSLPRGWHIHHINGNKQDNRLENLHAMPSREHMRYLQIQTRKIAEYEARIEELEKEVTEWKAKAGG